MRTSGVASLLPLLFAATQYGAEGTSPATCGNGIAGVVSADGDFCCDVGCSACGGRDCRDLGGRKDECCTRAIAESDVYCESSGAPPCIIPSPPSSDDEAKRCSGGIPGIQTGDYCCDPGCSACGGSGCKDFGRRWETCCTREIAASDIYCDVTSEAPCIVTPAPACDPEEKDACPYGQICCPTKKICEEPKDGTDPAACGDPHMTGFLGQKFDFTGVDGGYYALVGDLPDLHLNMRVTSPMPSLPEITYITGLSVLTADAEGNWHSIVIEVREPHNIESSCPAGVSPCLADGSLRVLVDGEEALRAPGTVSLSDNVAVSAVNLPGECRSFGFEKYWELKKLENARAGRRLGEQLSMGEWILGDPTATNMEECTEYVAAADMTPGGLFAHQSEHASFQIVTPKATIRLTHGRLHQLAMRDPTDRFDLPEHTAWQMNLGLDHHEVSRTATGILGETAVPTRDADGNPIMTGMAAIRGSEEDYRVGGPLEFSFAMDNF